MAITVIMSHSQIDIELVALLDLIQGDQFSNSEIKRKLAEFRCSGDSDVETYLRRFAYTNEKSGVSRTYLALDYDRYTGDHLLPPIVAYFTLSMTSTDYSGVDQEIKEELLGFVPKDVRRDHFSGYLLAQIGRSDDYDHEKLNGADLLVEAEIKIADAMRLVGGRVVYLDCKNSNSLISLYKKNGYAVLYEADEGDHPVKMAKALELV